MRVVTNRKSAETHIKRISEKHPDTGIIRILRLTEKQFSSVMNLTETDDLQEKTVGNNEMMLGSKGPSAPKLPVDCSR
jgi:CRISPR/Cas system-associated protein endoribonuclease Cas2